MRLARLKHDAQPQRLHGVDHLARQRVAHRLLPAHAAALGARAGCVEVDWV